MMKPGTSGGEIPAKVSLSDRAMVTAGLANDVDEVNPVSRGDVEANGERDGVRPAKGRPVPRRDGHIRRGPLDPPNSK
jgi:hypothetical protein